MPATNEEAERLVKEFNETWRRTVGIETDRNRNALNRLLILAETLNSQERIRLAYMEMPRMTFGVYTYPPITIEAFVQFDLDKAVPRVPHGVQKEFLALVNRLAEQYDVLSYEIGFRFTNSFDMKLVPANLENPRVHHSPMMKIKLCLENAPE